MNEDYYSEEYCNEDYDEEVPCDYGADSECVEPSKRNIGCCFECWLYQEMEEESEKKSTKQKGGKEHE